MLVPSLVALATAMSTLTSATPISTSADAAAVVPEIARSVAPLLSHAVDMGKDAIEDSYIVVLKPSVPTTFLASHLSEVTAHHSSSSLADDPEAGITNIYDSERLVGYAGKFDQATLDLIRSQEEVDFVELDSVVTTQETELGAPWGLARLSHRQTLRLSTFTKYEYDAISGEGVDVYVVDTGINIDHVEFEGRASWGKTIPKNDEDKDGNGHGSHCAGTIASRKYGVAKKAHVIAVKVLGSNGSGSMSDVVDGVLYAAESAKKKAKSSAEEFSATGKTSHVGSVASMSLGGGKSPALDRAVNAAVASGLHFAVAAGNDNKDACNYSPAAAEKAITVGASTLGDERAYFSNHGSCVDIFAPGLNILSTWTGGNTTTNVISGTSMATPHIAGLLAYLLSVHGTKSFSPTNALSFGPAGVLEKAVSLLPSYIQAFLPGPQSAFAPVPKKPEALTPAELKKALLKLATVDTLSDANGAELPVGSPNLLAFNNYTTQG